VDQSTALNILKSGQNVFLTGSAGTGKTYVINQYVQYLREREVPLAITASTGIAATHIDGQTIHSWSGIGIRDLINEKALDKIARNRQTVTRIKAASVLIIDEISMLSGKVLTGINVILQHFRKSTAPFGGLQVILSGDFFQLPPVSREPMTNKEKFAFMAPVWVEANFKICYLSHQYRQGRDALSFILDEIRTQDVSDDSLDRFKEKLEDDQKIDEAIQLFTHNADVDAMNTQKLMVNQNPLKVYYAQTEGHSNLVESLKSSVMAPHELSLKLDARVIFVKNNPDKGYFNGTMGVIVDFDREDDYPIVELSDGRTILAQPEEWTVSDEQEIILASFKQIPLRLAWAITIHKSQGMTLSQATLDLSKTFETGQGYVALSRLKSWDGLVLNGINQIALRLDSLAIKADKRFRELSETSEDWLNIYPKKDLVSLHDAFIIRSGGTLDPVIIEGYETKEKKYYKKEVKENTFQVTLEMVKKGKSIGEIAVERELTEGTIVGHLERIKADHPDVDITRFSPSHDILSKVEKTIEKIKEQHREDLLDKEGNAKIGYIHKALNGNLDYETIRLAKIFID
jgi:GTPase SAR1 family protein